MIPGFRNASRARHEIAAVIIAMHEHLRLFSCGVDQAHEREFDDVPLLARDLVAEMPAQKPLRHDLQLHGQERFVKDGQARGIDIRLHAQQRVERIGIERIGRGVVQLGQIGARRGLPSG
jgi:hypothetical protein